MLILTSNCKMLIFTWTLKVLRSLNRSDPVFTDVAIIIYGSVENLGNCLYISSCRHRWQWFWQSQDFHYRRNCWVWDFSPLEIVWSVKSRVDFVLPVLGYCPCGHLMQITIGASSEIVTAVQSWLYLSETLWSSDTNDQASGAIEPLKEERELCIWEDHSPMQNC